MKLIGKGRQAEVYATSDTECIKLFYPEIPKYDIEKEASIMQYIISLGIPTPKYYELTLVNNRNAIKMELINGFSLLDGVLTNPDKALYYASQMGYIQHSFNSIIANKLERIEDKLKYSIKNTTHLTLNEINAILKLLDKMPKDNKLLHTDYHLDNLLMSNANIYVIDWIGAVCGNPMADVARTYLSFCPGQYPIDASEQICQQIDAGRELMKISYLEAYGTCLEEFKEWLPIIAASRLEYAPKEEFVEDIRLIKEKLYSD